MTDLTHLTPFLTAAALAFLGYYALYILVRLGK